MQPDALAASVVIPVLAVFLHPVLAEEPAVENAVHAACLKHGHFDFKPLKGSVWTVSFSADGRRLAAGCLESPPTVWDTTTGRKIRSLDEIDATWLATMSPDGKLLAAYKGERTVGI